MIRRMLVICLYQYRFTMKILSLVHYLTFNSFIFSLIAFFDHLEFRGSGWRGLSISCNHSSNESTLSWISEKVEKRWVMVRCFIRVGNDYLSSTTLIKTTPECKFFTLNLKVFVNEIYFWPCNNCLSVRPINALS